MYKKFQICIFYQNFINKNKNLKNYSIFISNLWLTKWQISLRLQMCIIQIISVSFQSFHTKCVQVHIMAINFFEIFFVFSEIAIGAFAFIGNLIIIIVFLWDKTLRKKRNFLMFALALANIFRSVFEIPFSILVSWIFLRD